MSAIYHIASTRDVAQASATGKYAPRKYEADGFIHCSHARQVLGVANAKYRGRDGLALLEIDRDRLPCRVVTENLEGSTELFPHSYGRLPMSAVIAMHDFPCEPDGRFRLPSTVSIDRP